MQNHVSCLEPDVCVLPAPTPKAHARHILHTLKVWYDRWKGRRDLAKLDARLLADIGQDQYSAAREAAKPFWQE